MSELWKNVVRKSEATPAAAAAAASPQAAAAEGGGVPTASEGGAAVSITEDDTPTDPLSTPATEEEAAAVAAAATPAPIYGKHISVDDLQRIRGFVSALGSRGVLPFLENIAGQLDAHIARSKKSTFSSAKKWLGFGSEKKASEAKAAEQSMFANMPIRDAMRRYADVKFVLQDYETAHNTYNSVKKDFNHDKAWKHFAGAQEMLGISQIYMEDSRGVDCRYFDVAINAYMKCNATLYGCRAMLIVTEMLTSRGQFKEASTFFMKMTSEESDLRSALLYEQASMCFLQMKPTCQRRAAFHLVLAGHRFTKASQRTHALRCYQQARQVYNGRGWQLAEDHVNFIIGRQASLLGHSPEALDAFSRLLVDSQQYGKQQQQYISEFVPAWRKVYGTGACLETLPVPNVVDSSLELALREESLSESAAADWRKIESTLLFVAHPKRQRVNSVSRLTRHTDNTAKPICVSGESLGLKFTVSNPLHVALELRGIALIASMEGEDDAESSIEAESIPLFKLPPNSEKEIALQAIPRKTGQMSIKGFSYSLGGTVFGMQRFEAKGKRLNKKKSHWQEPVYGPDLRLTPIVIPPMPLLTGAISGIEAPIYVGEMTAATITLKNNSDARLLNLHVSCSRPDMIMFGDDVTARDRDPVGNPTVVKVNTGGATGLAGGASIDVPISISAGVGDVGNVQLLVMLCYEAESVHSALPYRVLRLSHTVNVLPSVGARSNVLKIPQVFNERLFRLTAHARQPPGLKLSLNSIVFGKSQWDVELDGSTKAAANSKGGGDGFTFDCGETISLVCKMRRKEKGAAQDVLTPAVVLNGVTAASASELGRVEAEFFDRATRAESSNPDVKFLLLWDLMKADGSKQCSGQTAGVASARFEAREVRVRAGSATVRSRGSANAASKAERNALAQDVELVLEHKETFEHDFESNPLLTIPVVIKVVNTAQRSASAVINLLPPSDDEKVSGNLFSWAGKTKIKVELEPEELVSVSVAAKVTEAGVFDLNRLSAATFNGTVAVKIGHKESSLVHVTSAISSA